MRIKTYAKTTKTVRWILALSIFGTFTPYVLAANSDVFASFTDTEGEEWICDYTVKDDGLWYVRCEDLTRLRNEDPVLSDSTQSRQAEYIPLWGAPYASSRSAELAKIVLCEKKASCNVILAAR